MKNQKVWEITCTQLVANENLCSSEDKENFNLGLNGKEVVKIVASNKTDALEEFHSHWSIGCLDDYEITILPV